MTMHSKETVSFENVELFPVDIQANRWNPFSYGTGHLIGLSPNEFQIKFHKPIKLKIGRRVKIKIYLLNSSQKFIKIAAIVKWVDEIDKKTGGIFIQEKQAQRLETICRSLTKGNTPS